MTLSQAKNAMQRAIDDLIGPPLSAAEKDRVWSFFESACAYCGRKLTKDSREGHIDHLVSRSNGGSNNLSNCVLACRECNGNEKRDLPWEDFLRSKCSDRLSVAARRKRIVSWQSQPATREPVVLSAEAKAAKRQVEAVIGEYEMRFAQLREKIR